jgi:hypothetical protein
VRGPAFLSLMLSTISHLCVRINVTLALTSNAHCSKAYEAKNASGRSCGEPAEAAVLSIDSDPSTPPDASMHSALFRTEAEDKVKPRRIRRRYSEPSGHDSMDIWRCVLLASLSSRWAFPDLLQTPI